LNAQRIKRKLSNPLLRLPGLGRSKEVQEARGRWNEENGIHHGGVLWKGRGREIEAFLSKLKRGSRKVTLKNNHSRQRSAYEE